MTLDVGDGLATHGIVPQLLGCHKSDPFSGPPGAACADPTMTRLMLYGAPVRTFGSDGVSSMDPSTRETATENVAT